MASADLFPVRLLKLLHRYAKTCMVGPPGHTVTSSRIAIHAPTVRISVPPRLRVLTVTFTVSDLPHERDTSCIVAFEQ